jgi:anti-anti-sigma factor
MVQVVRTGEGDATVWQVVGELDLGSAEVLGTAIVPNGEVCLTLDLSDLTFIDSSGIAALEKLASAGRMVVLRGPTRNVRRVFEISGLDQHPCISIEDPSSV